MTYALGLRMMVCAAVGAASLSLAACSGRDAGNDASVQILNASYDPTRELYEAINPKFAAAWKATSGQDLKLKDYRPRPVGSGRKAEA